MESDLLATKPPSHHCEWHVNSFCTTTKPHLHVKEAIINTTTNPWPTPPLPPTLYYPSFFSQSITAAILFRRPLCHPSHLPHLRACTPPPPRAKPAKSGHRYNHPTPPFTVFTVFTFWLSTTELSPSAPPLRRPSFPSRSATSSSAPGGVRMWSMPVEGVKFGFGFKKWGKGVSISVCWVLRFFRTNCSRGITIIIIGYETENLSGRDL